jgi:predicted ATPase
LVAEGKLNTEDFVIYFVDYDEEKGASSLKRINVDDLGEVDFWPEDIFRETLYETIRIRKAQKNKV